MIAAIAIGIGENNYDDKYTIDNWFRPDASHMVTVVEGKRGEKVLLSTNRKLPANRLLVYSLGSSKDFDNMSFVESSQEIFEIVKGLKSESCAMNVPGTSHRDSEYFLERSAILMKEIRGHYTGNVSLFIGGNESFKEIRPKLDLILAEVDKLSVANNKGRKR